MKQFLLLEFLFLTFFSVNAQKVKVTWGEVSKIELDYKSFVNGSGSDMIKLCTESNGGGLFSKKTITPVLARYNDKLTELNVRKYEVDNSGISFKNLLSIKGKVFMFTSEYDKETKSTIYYSQEIDIKNLNPIGKPINMGSFEALNKTSTSSVDFIISKDSTKLMTLAFSPFSKKGNEKYYMAVYDNNMKKMWENTVELPYMDKYIKVLNSIVTNDGKVGIIIKHYDKEVTSESVKGDDSRIPSYITKFLLYEKDNKTPKEYVLNTNEKFIHALKLTNDLNNNLTLFGMYKNKYNGYVSGFFTTNINTLTKEVSSSKMEAFPDALVDQIQIDKQGSDKDKDPGLSTYFSLEKIIDRADGSKDYILEFSRVIFHQGTTMYVNGRTSTTPSYWTYDYGDIIDINIKKDNKIFITRIPKMQSSRNSCIYSNFQVLPFNDKLVFFYNDEKDNIDRDIAKKPDDVSKFGKSVLAMAVIDAKAGLTRTIIYDHRDMDLTTCIRESRPLDSKRIGLYAQKGGGLFSSSKDMIGILEIY